MTGGDGTGGSDGTDGNNIANGSQMAGQQRKRGQRIGGPTQDPLKPVWDVLSPDIERADLDFKQHLWHGTRTLEAEH